MTYIATIVAKSYNWDVHFILILLRQYIPSKMPFIWMIRTNISQETFVEIILNFYLIDSCAIFFPPDNDKTQTVTTFFREKSVPHQGGLHISIDTSPTSTVEVPIEAALKWRDLEYVQSFKCFMDIVSLNYENSLH